MVNVEALFSDVDDFCQRFEPEWQKQLLEAQPRQRQRASSLVMSEVMTILILFHVTRYRDFKTFYTQHVCRFLTAEFPQLVSYTRLLALKKECLIPLCAFLTSRKANPSSIAFIDATKLAVCHNIRIPRI
jgi:hypothetical protein